MNLLFTIIKKSLKSIVANWQHFSLIVYKSIIVTTLILDAAIKERIISCIKCFKYNTIYSNLFRFQILWLEPSFKVTKKKSPKNVPAKSEDNWDTMGMTRKYDVVFFLDLVLQLGHISTFSSPWYRKQFSQ